jgi:hypothetical protein
MSTSTQNGSYLKLVMLFDHRRQTCSICSHNLDTQDASQEVAELRRDGLSAFMLDQSSRHTEFDPDECLACRQDFEESLNPPPIFKRRRGMRFCP